MAGVQEEELPLVGLTSKTKALVAADVSGAGSSKRFSHLNVSSSGGSHATDAGSQEIPIQLRKGGPGDGFEDRLLAGVSRTQLQDLQDAFDMFDQNGEGTITPAKLGNVMRSLGENPTEAEVQDLILAVDDDGNGTVEFDEFVRMMRKKVNEPVQGEDVAAAFKVFDRGGNGAVLVDDLADVLGRLGWTDLTSEELEEMIRVAGGDDDKKVTLQDFQNLMKDI